MKLMKRHPKLKALLCLCGTFFLTLMLLTAVYYLFIYPPTQGSRYRVTIMLIWILGGSYLCHRLLARYTPWEKILENETGHPEKKQDNNSASPDSKTKEPKTYADYSKSRCDDGETKDFAE